MEKMWGKKILDLLLPRRCRVCGRTLLGREKLLCTFCAMDMPLTYFWTMQTNPMSERLNLKIQDFRNKHNISGYEPYSFAAALYFYKGDYREISKNLKYHADIPLGAYISSVLGRKTGQSPLFEDADLVIPVPLHWSRLMTRGYNQAEIIAEGLGIKVASRIIRRTRRTKTQTKVDVSQKAANVGGAFSVDMKQLREMLQRGPVRHIVIVDDVFTTGSTITECHQCLRQGLKEVLGEKEGSRVRISAITLAFVGD